jgi:hypothetical protein
MEFHRHSPCVREQRQGMAGSPAPRRTGMRARTRTSRLAPLPDGIPAGIRCDLWSFQRWVGAATRVCEIIALGYRPCGRGGFEPPTSRLAAGAPTMESRGAFAARGVTTTGSETIALPLSYRPPVEWWTRRDSNPQQMEFRRHSSRNTIGHGDEVVREASFRHGVGGVFPARRAQGGCTPTRHSPWIQPGGRGMAGTTPPRRLPACGRLPGPPSRS